MTKAKKRSIIALDVFLCVLLVIVIVANFIALPYSALISQFLGQETTRIESLDGGEVGDTTHFTSKYNNYREITAAQNELAYEIQAEGSVLLQNANLPLAKTGKITLMGSDIAPDNFLLGGGGSGAVGAGNTPNLKEVFEAAGYQVNDVMWAYYNVGAGHGVRTAQQVGEQPISGLGSAELNSVKEYSDAAILVFGRSGGEGNDPGFTTTEDPEKHMLEFSQNEMDLIDFALDNFSTVVVLLNNTNAMELGYLEDKSLSVLWIGVGGQQGVGAVAEILNGTRYPSGSLVDTYAYDLFSAPSTVNQGSFTFTNVETQFRNNYYVYAENIYVGYKYYETRYADKVMNQGNAGDYDYADTVQYPFGFTQGYTTFSTGDFNVTENADGYTVDVTVTNTGNTAGKKSVQIYMQSPYTDYDKANGIEKPAVELVGFGKTSELAAGASEKVTVTVSKEVMRAYDAQNAKTYIVDAGDYYFAVGDNAHDAVNNILAAQGYTTANGMTANGDASKTWKTTVSVLDSTTYSVGVNGEKITNQFDEADIRHFDSSFKYLTRSDWTGTYPAPYGGEDKETEATADMLAAMTVDWFPTDATATMPTTGTEGTLTLTSMIGLNYDDPKWEELLNMLTAKDMMTLVSDGGFGTPTISTVNKPATTDKDGPAGISATLIGGASSFGYPAEVLIASTWNTDFAKRMGELVAEDALMTGVSGWYAPGMNIHRSAFSGRNFEYYSEDSFMGGKMAAALVRAAREGGVVCYMKHFALNDQETNRPSACTFANEQTIRDYLETFEAAVREGGASAIMTSYNSIGCVWSGHHAGLITNICRGEWGFVGNIITDYMTTYADARNAQAATFAGQDMYLNSNAGAWFIDGYANNASVMQSLRRASHNILYVYANSNAMNGISEATRVIEITPAWQYWMYALDALLAIAAVLYTVYAVRTIKAAGGNVVEETAEQAKRRRITTAIVAAVVVAIVAFAAVAIMNFIGARTF